jgi:MFS transporter, SET family, sugar efflux transporter
MRRQVAIIWGNPTLRMLFGVTLGFGAYVSTIGPYQSLIAVRALGISESAYAAILAGSLVVAVLTSVGIGILTDQRPSRRLMALVSCASVVISALLVGLGQSAAAFVVAHAILLPVSGTLFGQIFAVARLSTANLPPADRDSVLTILRGMFAVPWLIVLPAWGLAFDQGLSILAVYGGLVVFGAANFLFVWRFWPSDAGAPWVEVKSGLRFRAALAEILTPPVFLRVQLIGILQTGGALCGILVGLTFAEAGRGTGEVSLFFAIFVAIEAIATLTLAPALRILGRMVLITLGVLLYAVFIGLLPHLAGSWLVWMLAIPAGLGGAFIYPLVIFYLADLLGARAGAGASLLALGRIGQDGMSAGSFWIGTLIAGYGLVAALGAAATLLALALVVWLDRNRPAF